MRTASALALVLTTAVLVFSVHRSLSPSAGVDGAGSASESSHRTTEPGRTPSGEVRRARTPERSAGAEEPPAAAAEDDVPRVTLDTSETYRNTSILMAIRDAGYVCVDIIAADAGSDEISAWRVVCDGALAYLVGADDSGGLAVEPLHYNDALFPFDSRPGPPDQSPSNPLPMELIPVEPR